MADQAKLKVAHGLLAAWNAGDLSLNDANEAEDMLSERPGVDGPLNKQQVRAYMQNFLTAFPGSQYEIWLTVAEGDYVVEHWTITGTNTGPLRSLSGDLIPPTGRNITVKGILTSEVKDGKVTRTWGFFDMALLMQQMGLLPAM